ncbi:YggS family pyridoxal phosphate-dependent enzyme [Arthrobacter sp. M4]|uniref:YggS family pyridoxal phosphate-dependent enzyme n=1 Tax=Arthrobacter sp. M4 TaxID=218160 RepID=UPI001CDBA882|nr:YggS family pyridoxal phosphate-dependent enzyme [Arthrobacter sp. M4]MCA4132769.1 YggS family pyridoxal phosphate-dependent enzyme [Arthrobacter sp. M4]
MTEALGQGHEFGTGDERLAQLKSRLEAVRERISKATLDAGRTDEPALIVVTKFHPAQDIRRLAALGVTDIGESRDQEASAKAEELADLDVRWHFIGQLQGNKAKSVARYAHVVHSIDRPKLVDALARAVSAEQDATARPAMDCFIQVSLDDDAGSHRGGASQADVGLLADRIAAASSLTLAGVMAVAPLGADPSAAFEKLAGISERLRSAHPGATGVSAGMSQDLEEAVRHGATHLRIGSDILGSRPAVR